MLVVLELAVQCVCRKDDRVAYCTLDVVDLGFDAIDAVGDAGFQTMDITANTCNLRRDSVRNKLLQFIQLTVFHMFQCRKLVRL